MTIADLSGAEPPPRAYRSALRTSRARATRERIATEARTLFRERGWAATHVRDVAHAADVSEATVYAVYDNKAGLAHALVDAIELTADVPRSADDLQAQSAPGQIAELVRSDRILYDDGGDVIALLRDGGRSEPALLAAYRRGRVRGDRLRRDVFTRWPPGTLRGDMTSETAVDVYAALCNIDVYRELIDERSWTSRQVEHWWTGTVGAALLTSATGRRSS